MALFTGKGDAGTTKAFDCPPGVRISKASALPEALGALDELNALLGVVKMRAGAQTRYGKLLREVQEALFVVQAEVAGAEKHTEQARVEELERIIEAAEHELPPITRFSIAGGTELSAMLDYARTVARRAERRATAVVDAGARELSPETKAYLNRLSSLLFALARLANHEAGVEDEHPRY